MKRRKRRDCERTASLIRSSICDLISASFSRIQLSKVSLSRVNIVE